MEMNSSLSMSQVFDIINNYEKTIHDFYKAMSEGFSHLPRTSTFRTGNANNRSKKVKVGRKNRDKSQSKLVDKTLMEKLYKLHYISSIDLAGSVDDFKEAFEMAKTLE
ncbi:MAG: hypothetical protein MJE63_25885 [Proteobacteria bacterium]|nr:hypothetical protein [Pseudomonadota bacterium]